MDVNKLLLEHFEKLAIGVAGLVLALFVVTTAIKEQPADVERTKVEKANKEIAGKVDLATKNAPGPKPLGVAREVQLALGGGAEPQALPTWLFHKRPVITTKIEGIEIPEARHLEPSIESPVSGLGRITVAWEENSNDNLVKIDKYELFRAEGAPERGWKSIGSFDGAKKTYVDTNVQTKVDYFYKVVSTASVDDSLEPVKRARAKGGTVELPANMRVQESVAAGPIRTKADVYVKVLSVQLKSTPDDIKAGKPMQHPSAYVWVWKYFPDKKEWQKATYTEVKPGERIGKDDFVTDFELVETKTVRIKKPFGEVDANGAVLKDTRTGEQVTLNNQEIAPEIGEIEKNPKVTDDGGGAPPDKGKTK